MRSTLTANSLLLAICLALIGCGGGGSGEKKTIVVDKRTPVEREIAAINYAAGEAYASGNLDNAERLYTEALRLAHTIERPESIAINALGSATALRAMGRHEEAEARLDMILRSRTLAFPPVYVSWASYLRAAIRVDRHMPEEAIKWIEMAKAACAKGACREHVGLRVLMARARLIQGDLAEAASVAETAARKAASAGSKAEQANALRVQAEALLLMGDADKAYGLFEKAFKLDKSLENPGKMAHDLIGSGRALARLGRTEEAHRAWLRASDISSAAGEGDLTEEALGLLDDLVPSEQ